MSDNHELEERIRGLEIQMEDFRKNRFLRTLPGRVVALESFAEAVFRQQNSEEIQRILDMTESISAKRWDDEFGIESLSDIEAIALLRKPLNDFIGSLRSILDENTC